VLRHNGDDGLDVVAHQAEFVFFVVVGGMNGDLCRGQPEDEPTSSHIDVGELEDVPEKNRSGSGSVLKTIVYAPGITAFLSRT